MFVEVASALAKDNTLVRTDIPTNDLGFWRSRKRTCCKITMLPPGDYEVLGAICRSD